MNFLSDDLHHIDTVLGQVAEHPQTSQQVTPLLYLVRQNLRFVTERVRLLEGIQGMETPRDGSNHGGGGTFELMQPSIATYIPFSAEDLEEYDAEHGSEHGGEHGRLQ